MNSHKPDKLIQLAAKKVVVQLGSLNYHILYKEIG